MISKPLCKSPEILHRAFSRGKLRGIMNPVTNKLKVAVDRSYILKLHLIRSHKVVNAWDMTLNAQFSIRSYIFWVLTDSHFHTDIGTDINQLLQQISCKSQILQLTVCTIHSLVIVKLKEWTACYAIFDKRTETAGGLLHDLFWDSDQVWTRLQKKKKIPPTQTGLTRLLGHARMNQWVKKILPRQNLTKVNSTSTAKLHFWRRWDCHTSNRVQVRSVHKQILLSTQENCTICQNLLLYLHKQGFWNTKLQNVKSSQLRVDLILFNWFGSVSRIDSTWGIVVPTETTISAIRWCLISKWFKAYLSEYINMTEKKGKEPRWAYQCLREQTCSV
jgi:hypothetical protein